LAPPGKAESLRPRLEEFAKNNELFLNPKVDWKIGWMEEHQGRCFCDWEKRFCPCEYALEDLERFNGICLCGVLCTKQKLLYYQKVQKASPSTSKKLATKEERGQQQKRNEALFKKVFKKRKRG